MNQRKQKNKSEISAFLRLGLFKICEWYFWHRRLSTAHIAARLGRRSKRSNLGFGAKVDLQCVRAMLRHC